MNNHDEPTVNEQFSLPSIALLRARNEHVTVFSMSFPIMSKHHFDSIMNYLNSLLKMSNFSSDVTRDICYEVNKNRNSINNITIKCFGTHIYVQPNALYTMSTCGHESNVVKGRTYEHPNTIEVTIMTLPNHSPVGPFTAPIIDFLLERLYGNDSYRKNESYISLRRQVDAIPHQRHFREQLTAKPYDYNEGFTNSYIVNRPVREVLNHVSPQTEGECFENENGTEKIQINVYGFDQTIVSILVDPDNEVTLEEIKMFLDLIGETTIKPKDTSEQETPKNEEYTYINHMLKKLNLSPYDDTFRTNIGTTDSLYKTREVIENFINLVRNKKLVLEKSIDTYEETLTNLRRFSQNRAGNIVEYVHSINQKIESNRVFIAELDELEDALGKMRKKYDILDELAIC